MKWLLMIVIYSKSSATGTDVSLQEFSSVQNCQAAKVVLDGAINRGTGSYTVCVKQ